MTNQELEEKLKELKLEKRKLILKGKSTNLLDIKIEEVEKLLKEIKVKND